MFKLVFPQTLASVSRPASRDLQTAHIFAPSQLLIVALPSGPGDQVGKHWPRGCSKAGEVSVGTGQGDPTLRTGGSQRHTWHLPADWAMQVDHLPADWPVQSHCPAGHYGCRHSTKLAVTWTLKKKDGSRHLPHRRKGKGPLPFVLNDGGI